MRSQVCSWTPGDGDDRAGQREGREQAVVGTSDGSSVGPSSTTAASRGHDSSRLLASEMLPATSHVTAVSWQAEGSDRSMIPGLQHHSSMCPRASFVFSVHHQYL